METALKMGILEFTTSVYWVRVGLFLLPFLHSISKLQFVLVTSCFTSLYFPVNPVIYVCMSAVFRRQLLEMVAGLCGRGPRLQGDPAPLTDIRLDTEQIHHSTVYNQ